MASTIPLASADGCAVPATSWRPGDRIDRYELIQEIGSGAMGVVWLARDADLGRDVALKLIRTGGSTLPELRARLLREARAMARTPHANVVAVHDVGTTDGGLFIAMECLDGGTLGDWLRAAPRAWNDVVAKFVGAGRGLAEAHRAGLVHRDFKPENVLLGRDGVARVGDFGLAIPVGQPDPGDRPPTSDGLELAPTQNGDLVGTLAFMAPEQLLGNRVTARSDQFSFCVSLYEALYGVMPFGIPSGETHSAILLAAIAEGRIAFPPEDPGVPERLHAVLVRGLAYDPSDRWPSMDEVVGELELCHEKPRRRSLVALAGDAAAALSVALGGRRRSQGPGRRRKSSRQLFAHSPANAPTRPLRGSRRTERTPPLLVTHRALEAAGERAGF